MLYFHSVRGFLLTEIMLLSDSQMNTSHTVTAGLDT